MKFKNMELIFSDNLFPVKVSKQIFLAGPSPRYNEDSSFSTTWRHEVLNKLHELGYDGIVYIPIPRTMFLEGKSDQIDFSYDKQIKWEVDAMNRADVILFNINRSDKLPGYTTNVEFGRYLTSGRVVYYRPSESVKNRYLDGLSALNKLKIYSDQNEALVEVIKRTSKESIRVNGECTVPLLIWNSPQFKDWYYSLKIAENELHDFEIKSVITFNDDEILFGYNAWAKIWITKENRFKDNETIFSRTSISYVCAFYDHPEQGRLYLLTREFRTPVNNEQGYVYELAGGSAPGEDLTALENAVKELEEETGLKIGDEGRYMPLSDRQMFSTYLTTKLFAVGVKLTEEEYNKVVNDINNNVVHGENKEERIKLFFASEKDLRTHKYPVDWTTMGVIYMCNMAVAEK